MVALTRLQADGLTKHLNFILIKGLASKVEEVASFFCLNKDKNLIGFQNLFFSA